ncbi:MAG: hypothetical protein ACRDQZ_11305 [Mycobacteriales bacterium]
MAVIGAFLVFAVVLGVLLGQDARNVGLIGGAIGSALSVLFFHRSHQANIRTDEYHREMLEIRQLEILLAACGELTVGECEKTRQQMIQMASRTWLRDGAPRKPTARGPASGRATTRRRRRQETSPAVSESPG